MNSDNISMVRIYRIVKFTVRCFCWRSRWKIFRL